MIDLNFWRVVKSHTWFDSTTLYLLRRNDLFAVVLISSDDMILDTFTSFDNKSANAVYNKWKQRLMRNHKEWFDMIGDYDDNDIC